MRTYQHIIDTRSVKKVLNTLPDHWVIRELTERDYGIDLAVEIFENCGTDKNGRDMFECTGATFHIQIKGTASKISANRDGNFSCSLAKNSLSYFEKFSTPFFLFRVDASNPNAKSYFIWIQRYIKEVLDLHEPRWRTGSQDSFVVHIPSHNELGLRQDKIEKIASRPKLIQELVEFREIYSNLEGHLLAASNGELQIDDSSLKYMKLLARQICNLRTIYKYNNCCISGECAKALLSFVEGLTIASSNSDFSGWPHNYNFGLLANSIDGLSDIEDFIAESDSDSVY